MYALRGATSVEENTEHAIGEAVAELLREMLARNGISRADVVSALLTSTPELNASFPAHAARKEGWSDVPMLGAVELGVVGAPRGIVRVLLHVEGMRPSLPRHVYLRRAAALRPDLAEGT
jgi:chorismate mutase